MREKHRGICVEILIDLADIAVKIARYRQASDNHVPHFFWSECKTLFLKNQPIFEDFDEIYEDKEDKDEIRNAVETAINQIKTKNEKDLKIEQGFHAEEKYRLRQTRSKYRTALADTDFENYRDLVATWDAFVPKRDRETEEISKLGRVVLGYVIHRLLEILYPSPVQVAARPVPRVKVAAIILGITNPTLHEHLRELLKGSGIRLLRMEDAINHCLESYKQEMSHVEHIDLNIVSTMMKGVKKLDIQDKMDDPKKHRLKKVEKMKVTTPRSDAEEKHTQTPRQIPYDDMDPILSNVACTGKSALSLFMYFLNI